MKSVLAPEQLEALRRLGTCAVSNAIEAFDVRLRNSGFADASIHCIFEDFPPIVGYAATARVRTSVPPMQGHNYLDRTDWWSAILKIPAPRVVVVEDVENARDLALLSEKCTPISCARWAVSGWSQMALSAVCRRSETRVSSSLRETWLYLTPTPMSFSLEFPWRSAA